MAHSYLEIQMTERKDRFLRKLLVMLVAPDTSLNPYQRGKPPVWLSKQEKPHVGSTNPCCIVCQGIVNYLFQPFLNKWNKLNHNWLSVSLVLVKQFLSFPFVWRGYGWTCFGHHYSFKIRTIWRSTQLCSFKLLCSEKAGVICRKGWGCFCRG